MDVKFIGKAKLTKQGQLTLPYEARESLGIEAESELYWYEVDHFLICTKELMSQKGIEEMLKKRRK
ncbi:AbrB/MazE/SpoVT family DNA-binding domain-containing protein [Candidatus Woesearchaeota archaeon]|nr:AbrB/MazE/SpoVT family DNA-binding domain-containing protein [Candidatus Woesearchaeota archaeon]